MCGKDRANGEGAETTIDAEESITEEDVNGIEFIPSSLGLEDINVEGINHPTPGARYGHELHLHLLT